MNKARLERFYDTYDKEKIPGIDAELKQYTGRYEKLFEKLVAKYGGAEPEFEGNEEDSEVEKGGEVNKEVKEEEEREEDEEEEEEEEEAKKEKEEEKEFKKEEEEEKKKEEEEKKEEDTSPETKQQTPSPVKPQGRGRTTSKEDIRKRYPSMGNVLAFEGENNLIPTQKQLDERVAGGEQNLLMSKDDMAKMDAPGKNSEKVVVVVKKKKAGGCIIS